MRAFSLLLFVVLCNLQQVTAQCYGTFQYPSNTTVPDPGGVATTISTESWAGDYAYVELTGGHIYRFTSSVATDYITISTAVGSGAIAFGVQPVVITASNSGVHVVNFHTNSACGTANINRTTQVQRIYCPAGSNFCGGGDEVITNVSIGSINNSSGGCGNGGYSDFTGQSSIIYIGQPLGITVTNQNPFSGDQVVVYVDWDNDFEFGSDEEIIPLSTTNNITFSGTVVAPPITPGPVRMRVRLMYTGTPSPCDNTQYGEVEDYTLNVTPFVPVAPGIFAGGSGRGDVMASFINTPIASSIYSGGNGRGDVMASLTNAPIASSIYSGGNGRGDVMASLTNAPIASSIYSGGNGRGDVMASLTNAPIASSIYSGGNGRGDVMASLTNAPIASSIYSGGNGRGDVMASLTNAPIASSIYSGGNGRGDVMVSFMPSQVLLALRGILEGPYTSSSGLMNDALRNLPAFPLTEPYTALGYVHTGGGGGETVAPAVLSTTGNNAIVDWVVVELRSTANPASVLVSRSALLQRDGDVVATDGVSPISFALAPGNYHVSLRHRNHLGVMTGNAPALGPSTTLLDLSSAGTATFGTNARKSITGAFPAEVLWAGDVNFNGIVQYTGQDNDRDPILSAIGGVVPTNTTGGYRMEDVNMDGTVRYTGLDNDRDPILQNIGGVVPTNTRVGQLP